MNNCFSWKLIANDEYDMITKRLSLAETKVHVQTVYLLSS